MLKVNIIKKFLNKNFCIDNQKDLIKIQNILNKLNNLKKS